MHYVIQNLLHSKMLFTSQIYFCSLDDSTKLSDNSYEVQQRATRRKKPRPNPNNARKTPQCVSKRQKPPKGRRRKRTISIENRSKKALFNSLKFIRLYLTICLKILHCKILITRIKKKQEKKENGQYMWLFQEKGLQE